MKPLHLYLAAGMVVATIIGVQVVPAALADHYPEEGTARWECIERYGYSRWSDAHLDTCVARLRMGLKVYPVE